MTTESLAYPARVPGKTVPLPTFTFSSGYSVQVRRIAPDTAEQLQLAVAAELPAPPPPEQAVTTSDGAVTAPNPDDPAYVETLKQLTQARQQRFGEKLKALCETYALIAEVDTEAVAALRAALGAIGMTQDHLSDTQVFLWQIAATTTGDLQDLFGFVFGQSRATEAQIQQQQATF